MMKKTARCILYVLLTLPILNISFSFIPIKVNSTFNGTGTVIVDFPYLNGSFCVYGKDGIHRIATKDTILLFKANVSTGKNLFIVEENSNYNCTKKPLFEEEFFSITSISENWQCNNPEFLKVGIPGILYIESPGTKVNITSHAIFQSPSIIAYKIKESPFSSVSLYGENKTIVDYCDWRRNWRLKVCLNESCEIHSLGTCNNHWHTHFILIQNQKIEIIRDFVEIKKINFSSRTFNYSISLASWNKGVLAIDWLIVEKGPAVKALKPFNRVKLKITDPCLKEGCFIKFKSQRPIDFGIPFKYIGNEEVISLINFTGQIHGRISNFFGNLTVPKWHECFTDDFSTLNLSEWTYHWGPLSIEDGKRLKIGKFGDYNYIGAGVYKEWNVSNYKFVTVFFHYGQESAFPIALLSDNSTVEIRMHFQMYPDHGSKCWLQVERCNRYGCTTLASAPSSENNDFRCFAFYPRTLIAEINGTHLRAQIYTDGSLKASLSTNLPSNIIAYRYGARSFSGRGIVLLDSLSVYVPVVFKKANLSFYFPTTNITFDMFKHFPLERGQNRLFVPVNKFLVIWNGSGKILINNVNVFSYNGSGWKFIRPFTNPQGRFNLSFTNASVYAVLPTRTLPEEGIVYIKEMGLIYFNHGNITLFGQPIEINPKPTSKITLPSLTINGLKAKGKICVNDSDLVNATIMVDNRTIGNCKPFSIPSGNHTLKIFAFDSSYNIINFSKNLTLENIQINFTVLKRVKVNSSSTLDIPLQINTTKPLSIPITTLPLQIKNATCISEESLVVNKTCEIIIPVNVNISSLSSSSSSATYKISSDLDERISHLPVEVSLPLPHKPMANEKVLVYVCKSSNGGCEGNWEKVKNNVNGTYVSFNISLSEKLVNISIIQNQTQNGNQNAGNSMGSHGAGGNGGGGGLGGGGGWGGAIITKGYEEEENESSIESMVFVENETGGNESGNVSSNQTKNPPSLKKPVVAGTSFSFALFDPALIGMALVAILLGMFTKKKKSVKKRIRVSKKHKDFLIE